jgi:hypothetical protein
VSTRTLTKQCPCDRASASGPRAVIRDRRFEKGKVVSNIWWAEIACDRCDTPWREETA